jgi:hypothetical protein
VSKKIKTNKLHGSDGALSTTARRAKRENGGLGEDPPGSPKMTHQQVSELSKQVWEDDLPNKENIRRHERSRQNAYEGIASHTRALRFNGILVL